jgi:hypothetical protein
MKRRENHKKKEMDEMEKGLETIRKSEINTTKREKEKERKAGE